MLLEIDDAAARLVLQRLEFWADEPQRQFSETIPKHRFVRVFVTIGPPRQPVALQLTIIASGEGAETLGWHRQIADEDSFFESRHVDLLDKGSAAASPYMTNATTLRRQLESSSPYIKAKDEITSASSPRRAASPSTRPARRLAR
jgi:hypothetical protein